MGILQTFIHSVKQAIKNVNVFALVGKPGTGKSFRAQLIADKYKIDLIIDDGILIKNSSIIGGRSAKRESNPLTAIRTALYDDPFHRREMRRSLEKENFERILIIGTSNRMVEMIAHRLNLPHIQKIINIEEIASKEEIEIARRSREYEGKHIIPVPGIEVQRNYSQIFIDSIKIFLKKRFSFKKKNKFFEKSIVSPNFQNKGKLAISENALSQMVLHCVAEYDNSLKIEKIILIRQLYGYILKIIIKVPFGIALPSLVHNLQGYIIKNIEKFTGITLNEVNIIIGTIS